MRLAPRARALLAVLATIAGTLSAQPPVLLSPKPGAADVTIQPEIIVLSPAPIIPSSITTRWPNSEQDGRRSDEPTLLMLRASDAQTFPRAVWAKHAIRVRYAHIDPRMLRITTGTLSPATQYVCILHRLLIEGGTELPPLEFTFTTRPDVPRLARHSLIGTDALRCRDTITMVFSAPITTLPHPIASYLDISTSIGSVPHTITVDEKGQRVTVAPTDRWPAGATLRVDLKLGDATGEELDNKRIDVPVRAAGRLRVRATSIDGSPVADTVRSVVAANDAVAVVDKTYTVQCPPWPAPNWRFVRWESRDIPSVHGATSPLVSWTADCEQIGRTLDINAVVERVDTLNVPIQIDEGAVEVYDEDGVLLDIYDADDTIRLTSATSKLMLHAVAAAGSSFGQWSAVGTPIHGSPAPLVAIAMQVLHPGTPAATTAKPLVPTFMPPTGTERYRLRGQVQDIEPGPGFDVEESVTWTTPRKYDEMQSGTRVLCVAARDCWEILGYMSINGRTMFAGPQREACIEAPLLDPEHVVTVLVRRTPIQVRVELALLETDDQEDLIYDKHPHPDVRISAEVGRTLNGTTLWMPVGEAICRTPRDLARATWRVSCGDNVRLRIRDASSRGETWKFFAAVTNYVQPAGGNRVGDAWEYTFVVSEDRAVFGATNCSDRPSGLPEIRLRACFKAELGIEAVAVRMRVGGTPSRAQARFEQRWLDPLVYYDRFDDEPVGGRQLEYIPRRGTDVKVRFTRPIDITTVEAGGLILESYGNIDPMRVGRSGMDFTVSSSGEGNASYEPLDGGPLTTVVLHAFKPQTTPRLHATYFGALSVTATTSLRSLRGARLRSSSTFALNTMELPGFGVQLHSVALSDDGDWDLWPMVMDGEIYHAMYGGLLATDRAMHIDMGFRRLPPCSVQQGTIPDDCTYEQSDADLPMLFGDLLQYIEPAWLDRTDMAFTHMQTYDEDCKDQKGCLVGELNDIINKLRQRISSAQLGGGSTWDGIVVDLIDGGFAMINALMEPDDQDEYLGEHTMLEGAAGLWGVTPSGIRTGRGRHTTYTYRPRFYPRAAVLY